MDEKFFMLLQIMLRATNVSNIWSVNSTVWNLMVDTFDYHMLKEMGNMYCSTDCESICVFLTILLVPLYTHP
jgi:hypothetical protein